MKIDLNKEEIFNDYSNDLREINANDGKIHIGNHTVAVTLDGGLEIDFDVDIDITYSTVTEKDERGYNFYSYIASKDVYVLFNEAYLDGEEFALDGEIVTKIEDAIKKEVESAQ